MPATGLHARSIIARPRLGFMLRRPAHLLALSFGVGLIPVAPGTFGTLIALPLFWLLQRRLGANAFLALLLIMFVAGVWACARTGRALGVEDHKAIVWDETTAFLLVLFFTPPALLWQAFAFLLFRLFDILKPGPIRYAEKMVRGGLGVMLDDLIAAFATLLCLTLYKLITSPGGDWIGPGIV